MARLQIEFNNVDLSDYIIVTKGFTLFDGGDFSPTFDSSFDDIDGQRYIYKKLDSKKIEVPFALLPNPTIEDSYDFLMRTLNVDEPKELRFSNIPNKHCYAIPSGTIDFNEYLNGGTGSIDFIVPDAVFYSDEVKEFTAVKNDDGTYSIDVINNGTAPTSIDYEIQFPTDNGYIGIASPYGAIELGNIDDVDVEHIYSAIMLNDQYNQIDTSDRNVVHCKVDTFKNEGTFGTFTRNNVGYLGCNNYGTLDTGWNGAGCKLDIMNDVTAKNFQAWTKVIFETTKKTQTGYLCFCVASGTTPIASIDIRATSTSSDERYVDLICNGKVFKSIKYKNSTIMKADKGNLYIKKERETFTFYIEGTIETYVDDALKDVGADSVNIYFGNTKGAKTKSPVAVAYMGVNFLRFQHNSVDYIYDIPNRYYEGSTVLISGDDTKIYVDNVESQGDEILGSTYFLAPVGTTPILVNFSEWIESDPIIKARIRERFI